MKAHDGDRGINNPIRYSFDSKSDHFAINDETGAVYTKTKLDREEPRDDQMGSYVIEIVATEMNDKQVIFRVTNTIETMSTIFS